MDPNVVLNIPLFIKTHFQSFWAAKQKQSPAMACDKQETSQSKRCSGNKDWDSKYWAPRDR